jgi:hypothetical protein
VEVNSDNNILSPGITTTARRLTSNGNTKYYLGPGTHEVLVAIVDRRNSTNASIAGGGEDEVRPITQVDEGTGDYGVGGGLAQGTLAGEDPEEAT